jgi:hypothetical protein
MIDSLDQAKAALRAGVGAELFEVLGLSRSSVYRTLP